MKSRVKKAVIPAAGLGTRFLPVTKAIAKEMIPLVDTPVIHYIVEEAVKSGIEDIVLITAQRKEAIENYFDYNYELEDRLMKTGNIEQALSLRKIADSCNLICIFQKSPMGLGHAIGLAESVVGSDPFAVLLGDDVIETEGAPCTKQLLDVFEEKNQSVVGVMKVPPQDVSKYGIVGGELLSDRLLQVKELVEKPEVGSAPSQYAIPGRYVVSSEVFKWIKETGPGRGGEIQFTDALFRLAQSSGLLAYEFEGRRFDTGDRLGYIEATLHFAMKRPELRDPVQELLKKWSK